MQYCSLQHRSLLLSPVTSTTGYCFCFSSILSFFLELFLHWSPVAYWAPTDLGSSSFSILSFCLFILFMGSSRQEYWSGLPFPSPVDHILSDLSTMTHLSWVTLGVHWKDWCWSWNSNTLATSCEELTHWKRPWCWEGLRAEGEGDERGSDGWMASLTRWTWVWVNSGRWLWTRKPGVLRFMGLQRVGHDWVTELNWSSCTWWLLSCRPRQHITSFQ